jgi:hypothetical protein
MPNIIEFKTIGHEWPCPKRCGYKLVNSELVGVNEVHCSIGCHPLVYSIDARKYTSNDVFRKVGINAS